MKFVLVTHYYPPHIGGLEIVVQRQAQSLYRYGHTVTVVTFAGRNEQPGRSVESGVTVYRVRALNVFERYFNIPFPIGGIGLLRILWREIMKADIVHLHDVFYQSSWLTFFVTRWYQRPLFLTQHVGFVQHPSRIVMGIQRLIYGTIGKRIFHFSKSIITYNPIVRGLLDQYQVDPTKVLMTRNGINLTLFHPIREDQKMRLRGTFALPAQKPLVLFVGRLVSKKGFMTLLEARGSEYDLVFAGSGTVDPKWRSIPGVHFLGALSQARLAELYQAVDLFVLPCIGEVFTLAMQEAMASGLPIITTDDQAYLTYELDRRLLIFTKPEAHSLRDAICEVLGDEGLRQEMANYSLQLARKWFDWEANIQQTLDLYGIPTNNPQHLTKTEIPTPILPNAIEHASMSRIAFVSDAVLPYCKGGKETRLYEITNRLARNGHQIHVYTMKWWDGGNTVIHNGVHFHAICRAYPLYHGKRRSIKQAIMFGLATFKLLFARFDVLDVDHIPFFPLFSARVVTWLKQKRLQATWHEVWGKEYWQEYLTGHAAYIGYIVERLSFLLPDIIVSNSLHTTKRLREEGVKGNIKMIPLGVNLERIYSTPPASRRSDVIFVGRLLAHKNVDVLVQAIAIVKKTHASVSCLIIGKGPEKENIKAMIDKCGLRANIEILDSIVGDSNLYGLMKASKMLVLPSIREGFGLVAIEAHAAGIPVITSSHKNNATKALIQEGINGFVTEPTAESIACRICDVLSIGKSMEPQRDIEQYDWQIVAKRVELVLETQL